MGAFVVVEGILVGAWVVEVFIRMGALVVVEGILVGILVGG